MRVLGIDFGERRIGLAISEESGGWALPLDAIERTTDRRAIYQLAALARSREVGMVVLGEPRLLDGQPSANAARIRRFGERLGKVCGLPIRRIEETLTTVEAGERLRQAGLTLRGQRQRRDSLAAQILLQEFLDQAGPTSADEATANDPTGRDTADGDFA